MLGGNVAQAFVHTICGLYLPAEAGDAVPAHAGFPPRFARGLAQRGAAGSPERAGKVWFLPTDPPRLASYLRELCEGARGLALRLGRALAAARLPEAPRAPFELELRGPGGVERVLAALAIDASGDAALAAAAGAELDESPPEALQSPSYIVRLEGVDTRGLEAFARLRVSVAVASAVRDGALPAGSESVLLRPLGAPRAAGEAFLQVNVPKLDGRPYVPLDTGYRDALERSARASVEAVLGFLRGSRTELRAARVAAWPARIGLRETRRVRRRRRGDPRGRAGGPPPRRRGRALELADRALARSPPRALRASGRGPARCPSARWSRGAAGASAWRGAAPRRATRRWARCACSAPRSRRARRSAPPRRSRPTRRRELRAQEPARVRARLQAEGDAA